MALPPRIGESVKTSPQRIPPTVQQTQPVDLHHNDLRKVRTAEVQLDSNDLLRQGTQPEIPNYRNHVLQPKVSVDNFVQPVSTISRSKIPMRAPTNASTPDLRRSSATSIPSVSYTHLDVYKRQT